MLLRHDSIGTYFLNIVIIRRHTGQYIAWRDQLPSVTNKLRCSVWCYGP
jgi:hypothetical protein